MEHSGDRRHDIDWLRVILFGLLVPFHVAIGVYWSTYGLDINPNLDDLAIKTGLSSSKRMMTTVQTQSRLRAWFCIGCISGGSLHYS